METPEPGGPTPAEENTMPSGPADSGEAAEENPSWQMSLPDVDDETPGPDSPPVSDDADRAAEVLPAVAVDDPLPAEAQQSPDESSEGAVVLVEDPFVEGEAPDEAVAEADGSDAVGSATEETPSVEPVDPEEPRAEESEAAVVAEGVEEETAQAPRRPSVPWWPYFVYLVLWAGLAAGLAYVGMQAGTTYLSDSSAYPYLVLGGLIMTLLGPVLGVAGWLAARRHIDEGSRSGLFVAALLRAALFTVGGVALFWGALVLVDALRLDWL